MSTLAELEAAADALSLEEQKRLLRHLDRKLGGDARAAVNSKVAAPEVPKEELERIHALIEAEFSRVDAEGW